MGNNDFMWNEDAAGGCDVPTPRMPSIDDIKDFKKLLTEARTLARDVLGEAAVSGGPGFVLEVYDRLITHAQIRHMNES